MKQSQVGNGHIWAEYLGLLIVGATTYMVFALRHGDGNPVVDRGEPLMGLMGGALFIFFVFAFLLAGLAVLFAAKERPRPIGRLVFRSIVLVIALLMQPYLQPYLAPFDVLYAEELQRRADTLQLLGKSEAVAVSALGAPTYVKNLPDLSGLLASNSKQLRYRHWWPIWLGGTELLVDIRDDRVVRIVAR
jgi:hypothetical protein